MSGHQNPFPEVGRTPNFSIRTRQEKGIREQKRMANEGGLPVPSAQDLYCPSFSGSFPAFHYDVERLTGRFGKDKAQPQSGNVVRLSSQGERRNVPKITAHCDERARFRVLRDRLPERNS
jgi:hypothetical protein